MSHRTYVDDPFAVVHGIDHAVVADAQTPQVLLAGELSTAGRSGALASFSIRGTTRSRMSVGRDSSSLRADREKTTAYLSIRAKLPAGEQPFLDQFERFPWLFPRTFGNGDLA